MSNPTDPPLSRRAARQAELSAQDAHPEAYAQPVDRRERGGTPVSVPSSAPSDVSYRTEVRPRVPHYDAAPPSHTVIPGGPSIVPQPLVEPPLAPAAAAAQVRRRDFRPPAERLDPAPVAPASFDTSLEYHTQLTARPDARPGLPADLADTSSSAASVAPLHVIAPPSGAAHSSAVPSIASPAVEQTLSRRELRALREAAGLAPESAPESEGHGQLFTATPLAPEPHAAPDRLPELAAMPAAMPAPMPMPQPQLLPEPTPMSSAPSALQPSALQHSAPQHSAPQPPALEHSALQPSAPQPPAPQPVAPQPVTSSSSALSPSAPTGSHWSVGIHDDDDPFENTFSREVGSAVSMTNTNALVLPEMPLGNLTGPVSGTGEIIITGMLDLPRAVSSTGTVPTVHESPDIDDLFDPGDLAVGPADAAPVSALKAVSSHTGTTSLMTSGKRPAGNTVTTVLVAATVVMAVVAIGLFVLAAVNGLF